MRKRTTIASACLGLLISANSPNAEVVVHELTVGHHSNSPMSDTEADKILAETSSVLRSCNVTLKRKGVVQPFASAGTRSMIRDSTERDAVHAESFDIKVVTSIRFCRVSGAHAGCSWDPPSSDPEQPRRRSLIVEHIPITVSNTPDPSDKLKLLGILWAHEFGHMTGLWHRSEPKALMSMCRLQKDQVEITDQECGCFV